MKCCRLIPRLDIKGPNLVKGVHFEGLRVLGKPETFARNYFEQGADEIFFQDTVASLYERENLWTIVNNTAKEVFIPLTVGGGLRTLENIRQALSVGADKVALNTAAINRPSFIEEAARVFGSSTIVVAIETIKEEDGDYQVFVENGREATGVEAIGWAKEAERRGAGELVVSSIDRDGTGRGYDIQLLKAVTDSVSIPVVAHGGGGEAQQILEAIQSGGADAVAPASMLHYGMLQQHHERSFHEVEGNVEFLKHGQGFSKFGDASIEKIKSCLQDGGVTVRVSR